MKKTTVQLFLGMLVLLCLMSTGCASLKNDHYVVVLSMDGFRSDYPKLAHTPTLDSLGRVGIKSTFRPSFPSLTFPNHYSMATGLYPDHHGLVGNAFYASDMDSVYRMGKTDTRFFGGEPIWNTAHFQGVRSAIYFWVGSEYVVQGIRPDNWKPFSKSVPFSDRADSVIYWLQMPKKERPHLIMWYLEEPDEIAHHNSPESPKTIQKIESLDRLLGEFFTKARKLKNFNKIDFIVLADHGMATIKPEKSINLADYMSVDSFNYVFDGVPTLLYPKPSYLETAYSILKKLPYVTVWKKNEIPPKYVYGKNERVADLVVLPEIGTYIQFKKHPSKLLAAAHGYDNFAPEMEAIFYATGPSFKKHTELPTMANVNLYLIIAKLLHLKPAPNDGEEEVVNRLLR